MMFHQHFQYFTESKQNLQKGIVGASVAIVVGYSLWAYVLPWYRQRLILEQKRKAALEKLKMIDKEHAEKEIESMQSQIAKIRQESSNSKRATVKPAQPAFNLPTSHLSENPQISTDTRSNRQPRQINATRNSQAPRIQSDQIRSVPNRPGPQPELRTLSENMALDSSSAILRMEQDIEYQNSLIVDWEKEAIRESKQVSFRFRPHFQVAD